MRERELWHDVDRALRDGTLYAADEDTLRRFLKAVTDAPPSENPAFHARLEQASQTIRHLLADRYNHAQLTLSVRWAKIAAIGAVAGVVLMILQLLVTLVI